MASLRGDEVKIMAFCFLVGGGLIVTAIRNHKRHRKVSDTHRSKIATAPQGFVEFEGFAWPTGETTVVQGGHEAVYYSFELQQKVSNGKRTDWKPVYKSLHANPFFLVDATGLVRLDLTDVELNLEDSRKTLWARLDKIEKDRILNHVVKEQISGFPPSSGGVYNFFAGAFRVVETEIRVGAPIYATGNYQSITGGPQKIQQPGLRDFCQKVFEHSARRLKNVNHLLDTNRDGHVSCEEAVSGYGMAARLSRHKAQLPGSTETEFTVYGHLSSSASQQFFLASGFEEHLKGRLSLHLWLKFGGGAVLCTIGLLIATGNSVKTFLQNRSTAAISQATRALATAPAVRPVVKVLHEDPAVLHKECVQSISLSCYKLIDREKEYSLSPEQVQFYRRQIK